MTTTFTIDSMGKGFFAVVPYPGPLEAGAEVQIVHGASSGSYDIVYDGNCYGRVRQEEALMLTELEDYLGVHQVEGVLVTRASRSAKGYPIRLRISCPTADATVVRETLEAQGRTIYE
ncbi:hypothetical protein B484DRAFT_418387 [Ochromonadaceae sp. CCMP2298]|nr:hypothetical protein B484DRAFT_418387 [Ochromonadaceae sp. CCMP2298]